MNADLVKAVNRAGASINVGLVSEPTLYSDIAAGAGTFGADRHTTTSLVYGSSVGGDTTWSTGNDTLTPDAGMYWGLESRHGGNVYYGWMQYAMSSDGKTLSVTQAAFSDVPGESVMVGVVPEPSTYAMAVAGMACCGLAMWRRKRA